MIYDHPAGVEMGWIGHRPILSTPQGGKVALDKALLALWKFAAGRDLQTILREFPAEISAPCSGDEPGVMENQRQVQAALACLAEAGLLVRSIEQPIPAVPKEWGDSPMQGETVTAIVVAYNGREWLEICLPSLLEQTYSPIETLVVDNGSTDDTAIWLAAHYPQVRCLVLPQTISLAAALNQGVAAVKAGKEHRSIAKAEDSRQWTVDNGQVDGRDAVKSTAKSADLTTGGGYLLFLNQDIRLERNAVAALVERAQGDTACGAVAAKLKFLWAPAFLNGLGNHVGASGWGSDNYLGHLDLGQFDDLQDTSSACFAAALIPRAAWEVVGAVDDGFPLYYEDVEWCYRARLLGFSIRAAPQAVIYHAFSGRVPSGDRQDIPGGKLCNVVHGRLRFITRLLSPWMVFRFGLTYFAEDLFGFLAALVRLKTTQAGAYLDGWRQYLRSLGAILTERKHIQTRRRRSDAQIFTQQRGLPPPFIWHGLPELTWDLVQHDYAPLIISGKTKTMPEFGSDKDRRRVLILSKDVVDAHMGGSGVRNLEMARVLSSDCDVTLACPSHTSLDIPGIKIVTYQDSQPQALRALVENSDVVVISGDLFERFRFLQDGNTRLVVDFYAPIILENLHYYTGESFSVQDSFIAPAVEIINRLARLGDFFICGSERQLDFWMGVLAANGRVNPRNFARDPSLRSLIDVVTIGFPDRPPRPKPMLRGIHPCVPPEARIVLWGGGIWEWLDPLTLVRAWPQVLQQYPQARLVFMGTRHPNPEVPRHRMVEKTEALAAEIGEKDRTILFYPWVPYEEREGLLCEADVGVTLHPQHVETRYSIRTRIMDYFWARLPVLVNQGDVVSEWVNEYGVGRVVPSLDVDAAAQALIDLLAQTKDNQAAAFEPLLQRFSWQQVMQPLRQYCLYGDYAADREQRQVRLAGAARTHFGQSQIQRALYIYRQEGLGVLLHRIRRYAQTILSRP